MDRLQLSLSELQGMVKNALELALPESFWVKAEISELTVNRSGHCYLDLIETDSANTITARVRATIWSYTFRMLKPYFESTTGQSFSEGIKVLLNAKVEYHEVYGLSLNIRDIDPAYTLGDMVQQRRAIIVRLEKEGVFDMNKELEMPIVPQRIAIISSPTAAGLQDFIDQLHHNPQRIKFYTKLFPAMMQGKEAPASIIAALDRIFGYEDFFDAVAIIRGGGAQIDLAAFDNYDLAFHITQFPLPVITGIGHDKDDSVADMVAHTRMKTPTAVAEFLISTVEEFTAYLSELEQQFASVVNDRLQQSREQLSDLLNAVSNQARLKMKDERQLLEISGLKLKNGVENYLQDKKNEFHLLATEIKSSTGTFVRHHQNLLARAVQETRFSIKTTGWKKHNELKIFQHEMKYKIEDRLKLEKRQMLGLQEKLRLVDPQQILKRGFSLTFKDGKILKSVHQLSEDDRLETRLSDGTVISNVQTINFKSQKSKVKSQKNGISE
jgi:exodeoxyribonuclease VII large subunit